MTVMASVTETSATVVEILMVVVVDSITLVVVGFLV